MIELTPEVRDAAARAAYEHTAFSKYPGWDDLREEWREIQRGEVDAVAPILAAYWEEQQKAFEYERDMGDDL